jgi:hypothetical protein
MRVWRNEHERWLANNAARSSRFLKVASIIHSAEMVRILV